MTEGGSRLKQSFAWWSFASKEIPAEKLLRAAADIGYAGVDLIEQELWPLVKQHGLAISAIGGHKSIELGLNRRAQHDRIVEELEANIKLAERWAIPNLICFSGNRAGLEDEAGAIVTAEGLRRIAPLAEDAGVTLIVELLNSKVDHPDYQCDHTAWGAKVCELVGSPNVKLLYDIYHMQIMEGDIIRTVRDNHHLFGHYHTGGNPGRHEIDDSQELYYPPIVRAIAATGYTGFLCHEFLPTTDPITALRSAFEICEGATGGGDRP